MRRDPANGQAIKRRMGSAINASLAADRRRRADQPSGEKNDLLEMGIFVVTMTSDFYDNV